jgi:magnesium chelatase family protein
MQQRSNMGLPHEMHAELPRINYEKLTSKRTPEPLEDVLKRVERAKALRNDIRHSIEGASLSLMNAAIKQLDFDQWQYDTTINVARSIAALRYSTKVIDSIATEDLAEAIQYRSKY